MLIYFHNFLPQNEPVKTDKLWIGLNDLKTAMFFEWSDHSSVPFVSWETNEPSHNADNEEDCVLIKGEVGFLLNKRYL